MVLVWVFLGVVCLALEAAVSTAFFAFFMAIGFGAGALADTFGTPVWLQCLVVATVAVLGIVLGRPLLVGRTGPMTIAGQGFSSLVGQRCITVDEVGDEHHPGHAMLGGERWLAVSETQTALPPDLPVTVARVQGTTLIVRPADIGWLTRRLQTHEEHPA